MVPYLKRKNFDNVNIIADLRINKVAKGLRFDNYLKYKLLFESRVYTQLYIQFLDSRNSNGLQAIDFIAHTFFRKYEFKDIKYYQIIKGRTKKDERLFF